MKKYESVRNELVRALEYGHINDYDLKDFDELVERATPKKVIRMETQHKDLCLAYCECDYELSPTLKMPFCEICGQALDWSE